MARLSQHALRRVLGTLGPVAVDLLSKPPCRVILETEDPPARSRGRTPVPA